MLARQKKYTVLLCLFVLLATTDFSFAQHPVSPGVPTSPANSSGSATASSATSPSGKDSLPPMPILGPNDTIPVPAKLYKGEFLSAQNIDYAWVTIPMPPAMRKRYEEWTRLRNAVYVTYPYARKAGMILNDMNAKLATLSSDKEKSTYIKSREKDSQKRICRSA